MTDYEEMDMLNLQVKAQSERNHYHAIAVSNVSFACLVEAQKRLTKVTGTDDKMQTLSGAE
jgi:hypothetical protein